MSLGDRTEAHFCLLSCSSTHPPAGGQWAMVACFSHSASLRILEWDACLLGLVCLLVYTSWNKWANIQTVIQVTWSTRPEWDNVWEHFNLTDYRTQRIIYLCYKMSQSRKQRQILNVNESFILFWIQIITWSFFHFDLFGNFHPNFSKTS